MQQVVVCANCGAQNDSSQNFCSQCGALLVKIAPRQPTWQAPSPQTVASEHVPEVLPPQMFQFLGIAAVVFKIIGWVVLVGGMLGSIAVFLLMSQGALAGLSGLLNRLMEILGLGSVLGVAKVVIMLLGAVASLLLGLGMLAFADLCHAVRAIEARLKVQNSK